MFYDGGIGLVIPPRTLVVDIDPRNGGDKTILAAIVAQGHDFPETREVQTRSGGRHLYYRLPDDRELRSSLGPGVDIKKPGRGYVLVPPTPGYEYLRFGRIARAPRWLLDEITVTRLASVDPSVAKFFPLMAGTAYGLKVLRSELAYIRALEEGNRRAALNKSAYKLAGLVAAGELDEDKTLGQLLDAALDIGLDERQALSRMKSGWDAGIQKPWGPTS
jgi:hypothetical protein